MAFDNGPLRLEANVFGVQVPNHVRPMSVEWCFVLLRLNATHLQEGRAGMVALNPASAVGTSEQSTARQFTEADVDWAAFAEHVNNNLPSYARPLFVRLLRGEMEKTGMSCAEHDSVEMTFTDFCPNAQPGTFKHQKNGLSAQGFNPREIQDPLFVYLGRRYEPLTPATYDAIIAGRIHV